MKPILLIALGLAALGTGGRAAAATTTHASSGPPVIRERFTALPCAGAPAHRTTVELLGCAEHSVLRSDTTIDGLARQIYAALDRAGRDEFTTASRDWLAYRDAECAAAASPEAGGSEAPVTLAECLESEDAAHISALRTFLRDTVSSPATAPPPAPDAATHFQAPGLRHSPRTR